MTWQNQTLFNPADINVASWDEFWREGGELNQPKWLQTNRLKELRGIYTRLARIGTGVNKSISPKDN